MHAITGVISEFLMFDSVKCPSWPNAAKWTVRSNRISQERDQHCAHTSTEWEKITTRRMASSLISVGGFQPAGNTRTPQTVLHQEPMSVGSNIGCWCRIPTPTELVTPPCDAFFNRNTLDVFLLRHGSRRIIIKKILTIRQ